jgi:two-component system sensor histidine kinase DesK
MAVATLGYLLLPLNTGASTYLVYAGAMLGASGIGLRALLKWIFAAALVFALEAWLLGWPDPYIGLSVAINALLMVAIGAANHFHHEKRLRQAELKLSHDEVRRLAALAERERIGRDLHDLLGHTLSLITLKAELAAKLFDRDPLAARREIVDVERVARDALGQVRRAVTGIRTAGLGAELASARLLLESGDVRLDYAITSIALPPEVETVLALTLREAITNIQRHALASKARVDIETDAGEVRLTIIDDGVGGVIVPGNGLSGMRERLALLDGRLEIESMRGRGTRVCASIPMPSEMGPATAHALA